MAEQVSLPLFTLMSPDGMAFTPLMIKERVALPFFSSRENAQRFNDQSLWPSEITIIELKSAFCQLLHSISIDGKHFTDFDIVFDPPSPNEKEYKVARQEDFLRWVLDSPTRPAEASHAWPSHLVSAEPHTFTREVTAMQSADNDELILEGKRLASNLDALEGCPTDLLEAICEAYADEPHSFEKSVLLAELHKRSFHTPR